MPLFPLPLPLPFPWHSRNVEEIAPLFPNFPPCTSLHRDHLQHHPETSNPSLQVTKSHQENEQRIQISCKFDHTIIMNLTFRTLLTVVQWAFPSKAFTSSLHANPSIDQWSQFFQCFSHVCHPHCFSSQLCNSAQPPACHTRRSASDVSVCLPRGSVKQPSDIVSQAVRAIGFLLCWLGF